MLLLAPKTVSPVGQKSHGGENGLSGFSTPPGRGAVALVGGNANLPLVWISLLSVEHEDMADRADQVAVGCVGNGLGELSLLIFKILKADFNQFMMVECLVNRG